MTTWAQSSSAAAARTSVEGLQQQFKTHLERIGGAPLLYASWLRDDGRHGGGSRYVLARTGPFNRLAINVSQVHYDDDPARQLGSATALSTIIHPDNPRAPSVHIHISWTEMKASATGPAGGGWRVMADLNPSIPEPADTLRFAEALRAAAPDLAVDAARQGDRYFFIPALGRHRGVTHFYLESHRTSEPAADAALAQRVGEAAIDTYAAILEAALPRASSAADRAAQLAYHTVYFFQVLTLDRGTTSGLLVHDQNDVGILGSLPAAIDRQAFAATLERVPTAQRDLVTGLVDAVPESGEIDDAVRARLAQVVRAFYKAHPEALDLQAAGDVVPPTVQNHNRV